MDLHTMTDPRTGLVLIKPIDPDRCHLPWCWYPMPHSHTTET